MTEQSDDIQVTPYGMSLIIKGQATDGVLSGCLGIRVAKSIGTDIEIEIIIADPLNSEEIATYGRFKVTVGEVLAITEFGAQLNIEVTDPTAPIPEDPGILFLKRGDSNVG